MEASETITCCYLRSQGIKLLSRCLCRVSWGYELPFANRMPHFYARDRTAGRPKRLKAPHRVSEPFHCAMILLHKIIEILGVTNDNSGSVRLVVVLDRRRVAATLIDRAFLRQPLPANGFVQEGFGSVTTPSGSQQKVNRVARCVHGAIEGGPFPLDFSRTVEWREGVSPSRSHRTERDPRESFGSYCPAMDWKNCQ